jgi:hypothetical protein
MVTPRRTPTGTRRERAADGQEAAERRGAGRGGVVIRMPAPAVWGWRILLIVSGFLALNGVGLYLFIVDTQIERTIGVLLAAFGVLALVVAWEGARHGTRWAWNATWVVVGTLAAVGVHMLRGDRADLVATYLLLAAIALVGQLLARRGVAT